MKQWKAKKRKKAGIDRRPCHTPPCLVGTVPVQSKYRKTHFLESPHGLQHSCDDRRAVGRSSVISHTCSSPQTTLKEAFMGAGRWSSHLNSSQGAPHKAALGPFPFSKILGSHLSLPRKCPFQEAPQSSSTPSNPCFSTGRSQ